MIVKTKQGTKVRYQGRFRFVLLNEQVHLIGNPVQTPRPVEVVPKSAQTWKRSGDQRVLEQEIQRYRNRYGENARHLRDTAGRVTRTTVTEWTIVDTTTGEVVW
jgi:hypothetical protein